MKLLIDGMISGTGVRDALNGGYFELIDLNLSKSTQDRIEMWCAQYRSSNFTGYAPDRVKELDREGLAIAEIVSQELPQADVGYFSDALMKRLTVAP